MLHVWLAQLKKPHASAVHLTSLLLAMVYMLYI